MIEKIRAAVFGLAISDAMGVPVEFIDREELCSEPVADYRGFGTHHVPAGTWSDDTNTSALAAVPKRQSDIKTLKNFFLTKFSSVFLLMIFILYHIFSFM